MKKPTAKPRNPVARSPLLKKGGSHEKSRKSKRQAARARLRRERDETLD